MRALAARSRPALAACSRAFAPVVRALVAGLDALYVSYAARRIRAWARPRLRPLALVALLALGAAAIWELRTSTLEAALFHEFASRLTWSLGRGPSSSIVAPQHGPYVSRSGYDRIAYFASRLGREGFRVSRQARWSLLLALSTRLGFSPPYRETTSPGLVVRGADGRALFDAGEGAGRFRAYEDIPPVVSRSLLFIENRQLGALPGSRANPAVDWLRLARASLLYLGGHLGLPVHVEGGSTLAVQMEKYRHSAEGRTHGPSEKLLQIISASLRAYRDGPNTEAERRRIVLDYLNSMPLAAAPGCGEVEGLGQGLRVWFDADPRATFAALRDPAPSPAHAQALKRTLSLLCGARAPSDYLVRDRAALARRVALYTNLLEREGVIASPLARAVRAESLVFADAPATERSDHPIQLKAANLARNWLLDQLGVAGVYGLDRLDLQAQTTLDGALQDTVARVLDAFSDSAFVQSHGLAGEHLLASGDPLRVNYTVLLMERDSSGQRVCAYADNLDQPFDLNQGMKLELGSTAKLRALAHYLELIAGLHAELRHPDRDAETERSVRARDPLTRWVVAQMRASPKLSLDRLLERALDRRYSASPNEEFFTGGGNLTFHNFDARDNGLVLSVREATARSNNLVFIRLMRDLVAFHAARLPYDAAAVLSDPANGNRSSLLGEVADVESRTLLDAAYRRYRDRSPQAIEHRLLGRHADSPRHLAMLYYAWYPEGDSAGLAHWLEDRLGSTVPTVPVGRLSKAYGKLSLGIADFGYLLDRPALDVWCAGQLARDTTVSLDSLQASSDEARRTAQAWLFLARNRRAQDLRLRARIERDAFERMTPAWRRLGYPFERLVPSYASAIGSSSDRPIALAELMGIIVGGGTRTPVRVLEGLTFGAGTPYQTVLEPAEAPRPETVMHPAVARALRGVLAGVVEHGTAVRIRGAFGAGGGPAVPIGGKTGSGDNRYVTIARHGGARSTRVTSRTAAFAFYLGERHYGVITASVSGPDAAEYQFTSALPLELLKRLAPAFREHVAGRET